MKRLGFLLLPSVVVLGMIWIVFWANPTFAVPPPPPPPPPNPAANPPYIPPPPLLRTVVTPHVLLIPGNSRRIGDRAGCRGTHNRSTPYPAFPASPPIHCARPPA